MPYIRRDYRPEIDAYVREKIESLAKAQSVDLCVFYKKIFFELAREIYGLMSSNITIEGPSKLAQVIVNLGNKTAMAGNLHYAIAKMLIEVPKILKEVGLIDKEYNYNTHAFSTGALLKTALKLDKVLPDDGISSQLIGVFLDAFAEYKRCVNVPYEEAKKLENGDVGYGGVVVGCPSAFEQATIDQLSALTLRVGQLERQIRTMQKVEKKKTKKSTKVVDENKGNEEV